MFYNLQNYKEKLDYEESLKIIGSLSNLFSDAKEPYLYYRVAEKVFCKSFSSTDLSRSDVALDAYKGHLGIGLKTFLESNNKSFQKVAEFNKDKFLYQNKRAKELVEIVANLRNKRIHFTENLYGLENSIYHCIVRSSNLFKIHEEAMDYIDITNIKDIKETKSSIRFNDGIHDYSFNLSKSTLTKRFITDASKHEFDVQILLNPLEDIRKCILEGTLQYETNVKIIDTVYLPLYGKGKKVYERSGLNQWNAKGRERNINEVYIPIPMDVHRKRKNFFPSRDKPFTLKLPDGKSLIAKVCQSGDKALMSYSNRELGQWILREVLNLSEGEILTYDKLQIIGVDSVRIDKIDDENYEINFAKLGSYEKFLLD